MTTKTTVPVPPAIWLMVSGLAMLGVRAKRKAA
ncbi:MAG: PEP-CTERM sorting domain-containing protein [Gammaproteobacteria bacterium]|nr:PEP-CTERM sorting domain-containing protein [Gammaproteobacteria bacterium]HJP05172.1 PEP-CTERM sorting domain-containing protein [Gammaproteobacteria bacterium]